MKRVNAQKIPEILEALLESNDLLKKNYFEYKLRTGYFDVAGERLMPFVLNLEIRNRILYVRVKSAAARNEMMMKRESLTRALNAYVGASVIDTIVYL